jgi:hypothetical protein
MSSTRQWLAGRLQASPDHARQKYRGRFLRRAIFTAPLPRIPGRHRHGGTDPRSRQVPGIPSRRPGSMGSDAVPPVSGGPGAEPGGASAPHAAGAPRYPKPARPWRVGHATDRHRPAMYLQCTWHRPRAGLHRPGWKVPSAQSLKKKILRLSLQIAGVVAVTGLLGVSMAYDDVRERLARHVLTDGFHLTLDLPRSRGSWIAVPAEGPLGSYSA